MNKHIEKKLTLPDAKIYLIVILFLIVIIYTYNLWVGGAATILFLFLAYYNYRVSRQRREEWSTYLEDRTKDIEWATKNAVLSIPMPFVVLEANGNITWYNPKFGEIFQGQGLIEKNIRDLVPEIKPKLFTKEQEDNFQDLSVKDKNYRVYWNPLKIGTKRGKNKVILLLYWQDITEEERLKNLYNEKKLVTAYVHIDNYEEVLLGTDETIRPVVMAEIESKLGQWAASLNAGWIKYDKDKFLIIMENRELDLLKENRFDILDEIREIHAGNSIPVTLSIGVGADADTPSNSAASALSALELALGRGGGQAVVKHGTKLYFYGGKTKDVERRTKVKSRVISNVLRELMENSDGIFIMSHETPDLDSIGSSLGLYRCAKHIEKEAYVVLRGSNVSIDPIIDKIKNEEEYENLFITPEDALLKFSQDSLLIVVDTHRASFTECPELVNKAEKVVVIDHHRRGAESIEHGILNYLEPYASSASELVTEIVQYFDDKIKFNTIEADALLAGISVDTKNFIVKTGVRTYEAAAYLRRLGANPTSVRQLFLDDMETYTQRSDVVRSAKIIKPGIALAVCNIKAQNASLIAAQAADSLIAIKGITASFVLCPTDQGIMISGRSLGEINVQLILEKLGGGGHLTMAGAQLSDITIEEGKQRVIDAVNEYFEEDES